MNVYNKENIEEVKNDLLSSKIVAFPTDTVFGLACLTNDEVAKNKIYEAKNRPENKKLPMMVSSMEMLEKYCELNDETRKLFNAFTPGPMTFILKYKDSDETVAIRIPDDDWILDLINTVGKPLLVTSANISGEGSLIKYEDVVSQIGDRVDGIVKADARGDKPSTIVDCLNNFKILREGPITKEQIEKIIKGDSND